MMNLVDLGIWAILLIFVVRGFIRGLVREVCSLAGLVAGGWAAFSYYHHLAVTLRRFINLPSPAILALAFIAIFLVVGLLCYLIGHFLTAMFKIMLLGGINRVGGLIFGLAEGAFVLSMVLYFATFPQVPVPVRTALVRSGAGRSFSAAGRDIVAGWDSAPKHAVPTAPSKAAPSPADRHSR